MKHLFSWNFLAICACFGALLPSGHAQSRSAFFDDAGAPTSTPQSKNDKKTAALEMALIEQCDALGHRFDRRGLIYSDAVLDAHLSAVAAPLLPAALPKYVHWHFLVLRDPMVNSFALPNGTIYVTTGLLALLENDDQLAATLAHEITHVANGDAFQAQREYRRKEGERSVGKMAVTACGMAGCGLAGIASLALMMTSLAAQEAIADAGQPIQLLATSGYPDAVEHAADQSAVTLLARAGRDPGQLSRSLALMAAPLDAGPVLTFYQDPAKLQQRLASLSQTGGSEVQNSRDYTTVMQGAIRENISLDIEGRQYRTAVSSARRLASAFPDDGRAIYQLGDAYRSLGPRTAEPSAEERSVEGRHSAAKEMIKHTAAEEDKALAATATGRTAMSANGKRAEELFLQAAQMDARLAEPHWGLGSLYAQQGRIDEARNEYHKYLDLTPNPPDRRRVENRLADLDHLPPTQ